VDRTVFVLSILVFALVMLLSTDRLLLFLFAPTGLGTSDEVVEPNGDDGRELEPESSGTSAAASSAPAISAVRPLVPALATWVVAMVFAVVGIAQASPSGLEQSVLGGEEEERRAVRLRVDDSSIMPLPEKWELQGFERRGLDRAGAAVGRKFASAEWQVRRGDTTALVELSFPMSGWNEAANIYLSQGWEEVDRRSVGDGEEESSEDTALAIEMEKPTGEFAAAVISLFDENGAVLPPPTDSGWSWQNLKELLISRITRRGAELDETRPVYGFQMLVSSQSPLTPDEQNEFLDLYFAVRRQLMASVTGGPVRLPVRGTKSVEPATSDLD
jgi:hypothetical protein